MSPTFDELRAEAAEYAEASPDRRRTMRQKHLLARGIHPATRAALAGTDETCGSCGNARRVAWHNKNFWKCRLMPDTHGPGSDIRVSWPACVQWIPSPDSAPGMTIAELLGEIDRTLG